MLFTHIYTLSVSNMDHQNWISKLYNSAEKSAKCVRIGIFKNWKHCLECLKPKFHWYLLEDHWIEYAVCFTNYFEQISSVVVLLSPTLRQERRVLSIQTLNNPAKVCAGITRQNLFGNPLFVLSDLRPENSNVCRLLFSTVVDLIMIWCTTVSHRASHSTSNLLF